jgi:hypothetical protein
MGDITKLGGLAVGALRQFSGKEFSSQASMLIEELAKGPNVVKRSVTNTEAMVKGQIIGKFETAKRALENSTSNDLDYEARVAEIVRAWHLFEESYNIMASIEGFDKDRAKVAFYMAMCHSLLGHKTLTKNWLTRSINDYNVFIKSELPTASKFEEFTNEAVNTGSSVVGLGAGYMTVVNLAALALTVASGGAALPVLLSTATSATVFVAAKGTGDKLSKQSKDENERFIRHRDQKELAQTEVVEVQGVLEQFE